ITRVANVENADIPALHVFDHLKLFMKDLGSPMPTKVAERGAATPARQEIGCVKFIGYRHTVNITQMGAPAFDVLKNFVPIPMRNRDGRKNIHRPIC
ncbi:MAG: hypothetical protein RLN85_10705, partial [Pseudomonadales bacterium]